MEVEVNLNAAKAEEVEVGAKEKPKVVAVERATRDIIVETVIIGVVLFFSLAFSSSTSSSYSFSSFS